VPAVSARGVVPVRDFWQLSGMSKTPSISERSSVRSSLTYLKRRCQSGPVDFLVQGTLYPDVRPQSVRGHRR
jgi:GMP synthase PP-ATPase subunit